MIFRAFSMNGTPYLFTLEDSPSVIEESILLLCKYSNTEKLIYSTVSRQYQNTNYFEGDLVYIGDELKGYLLFKCGWKYYEVESGEVKTLINGIPYKFQTSTTAYSSTLVEKYKDPILFYADGFFFSMRRIIDVSNRIYLPKKLSVSLNVYPCTIYEDKPVPIGICYKDQLYTLNENEIRRESNVLSTTDSFRRCSLLPS